jgi:hypothetical protein
MKKAWLGFIILITLTIILSGYFLTSQEKPKCFPFPEKIDDFVCIEKKTLDERELFQLGCGYDYFYPELIHTVEYSKANTKLNFLAAKVKDFNLENCTKNIADFVSKNVSYDEFEFNEKVYLDLSPGDYNQNFERMIIWTNDNYYLKLSMVDDSKDNFLSKEKLGSLIPDLEEYIKRL